MASNGFLETVFDGGIRHANYFNGRLLSADDLKQDGEAEHLHHRLLGRAVGHGVVDGLWVTRAGSILTVTPGLAVNREGVALSLGATAFFNISPAVAAPPGADVIFTDCEPTQAPASATAKGAYLLVLCPVAKFEGLAPTKALNQGSQVPADCGPKWRVEGVGFRLIPVTLPFDAEAEGPRRQNRIAHFLLGSDRLADPSSPTFVLPEPVLDALPGLERHHLPLAVLYWTGSTIEFADNWAARRRLIRPSATLTGARGDSAASATALTPWGAYASDWRLAEAEARFLQFQDHFAEAMGQDRYLAFHIGQHFRYLPPVCFLPLGLDASAESLPYAFGCATMYVAPLSREEVGVLLARSWQHEPIDLRDTPAPRIHFFKVPATGTGAPHAMLVKHVPIETNLATYQSCAVSVP
jgi:hypothetical protein